MEIYFSLYVDQSIDKKKSLIHKVRSDINDITINKSYSSKLNSIYIGIICVTEKFKQFVPIRKPKLNRKEKYLEYDINLDINIVLDVSDSKIENYVRESVIRSLPLICDHDYEFKVEELIDDLT
jgi:CO dehydrogenase/acetyl-CoA synthase gamma subunit (corrinoid Fe-S protein)